MHYYDIALKRRQARLARSRGLSASVQPLRYAIVATRVDGAPVVVPARLAARNGNTKGGPKSADSGSLSDRRGRLKIPPANVLKSVARPTRGAIL